MPALTADRPCLTADPELRGPVPVAVGVVIFNGALVSVDTSGFARPARTSTTDRVIGFWKGDKIDNTVAATPARTIAPKRHMSIWCNNSAAGDAIATKDIGSDCFVVDDQTVALTNGTNTRVRAGKIEGVDAVRGVLVRIDA